MSIISTLFIGLLILPQKSFSQNNKYGIFIGIGKYPRERDILESSANDATEMCRLYSKNCGDKNTKLILDQNATRQAILDGILEFESRVKEGDHFVFYYSGHGTLFPDRFSEKLDEEISLENLLKPGEKYDAALIPYDSRDNTGERKWRNLILDDELYAHFARLTRKGAMVIFISDSCYSGGQAKNLDLGANTPEELGKAKFLDWKDAIGIKDETELETGIYVHKKFTPDPSLTNKYILIASSEETEPSYSKNPKTGYQMSLFTYYFIDVFREFKKVGKNFTFETIGEEVKPKVKEFAAIFNKKQNPYVDNDFYKKSLALPIF